MARGVFTSVYRVQTVRRDVRPLGKLLPVSRYAYHLIHQRFHRDPARCGERDWQIDVETVAVHRPHFPGKNREPGVVDAVRRLIEQHAAQPLQIHVYDRPRFAVDIDFDDGVGIRIVNIVPGETCIRDKIGNNPNVPDAPGPFCPKYLFGFPYRRLPIHDRLPLGARNCDGSWISGKFGSGKFITWFIRLPFLSSNCRVRTAHQPLLKRQIRLYRPYTNKL